MFTTLINLEGLIIVLSDLKCRSNNVIYKGCFIVGTTIIIKHLKDFRTQLIRGELKPSSVNKLINKLKNLYNV